MNIILTVIKLNENGRADINNGRPVIVILHYPQQTNTTAMMFINLDLQDSMFSWSLFWHFLSGSNKLGRDNTTDRYVSQHFQYCHISHSTVKPSSTKCGWLLWCFIEWDSPWIIWSILGLQKCMYFYHKSTFMPLTLLKSVCIFNTGIA
jgi:hypothetical protein